MFQRNHRLASGIVLPRSASWRPSLVAPRFRAAVRFGEGASTSGRAPLQAKNDALLTKTAGRAAFCRANPVAVLETLANLQVSIHA
jgi:hypothetical protein